jgi:ketosteroid isomerase-like protein
MIKNCAFFFSLLAVIAITQNVGLSQEPASMVRDEYLHVYNLHDADAVLALYADDAVLLSEAGVFRGKPEIRKWLQFAFDQGSVLENITATREKSSDTLAYGTGHTKRLVGKEIHLGHYLIVMEKRNGQWSIVEHASLNAHE